MADRYTYLPMVGLFVAMAWTIRWPAAAGAALAACCALTLLQLGYWSSHEALFRHALAVTPDNALAEGVLSEGLLHDGKLDEALRHAERSVELDPRGSKHWNNLAAVQRTAGRWDEAASSLQNALAVDLEETYLVGTGYGRVTLPFSKEHIRSEILCHGLGAHAMFPGTRTVPPSSIPSGILMRTVSTSAVRPRPRGTRARAGADHCGRGAAHPDRSARR